MWLLTDKEYRNCQEDYFQTIVPTDAKLSVEETILLKAQSRKLLKQLNSVCTNRKHHPMNCFKRNCPTCMKQLMKEIEYNV